MIYWRMIDEVDHEWELYADEPIRIRFKAPKFASNDPETPYVGRVPEVTIYQGDVAWGRYVGTHTPSVFEYWWSVISSVGKHICFRRPKT